MSHVLLEAEQHPADTIFKYQKGKFVMAEPSILPLRSTFSFEAGSRETILEQAGTRSSPSTRSTCATARR